MLTIAMIANHVCINEMVLLSFIELIEVYVIIKLGKLKINSLTIHNNYIIQINGHLLPSIRKYSTKQDNQIKASPRVVKN